MKAPKEKKAVKLGCAGLSWVKAGLSWFDRSRRYSEEVQGRNATPCAFFLWVWR